jgi:hypothetical protein
MGNLRTKLLKTTDDVKKAIAVPFTVKKERKQLESWLLDKEQRIAELESEINDLKAADKLEADSILRKIDDLDLTTRKLNQGNTLLKELFEDKVSEEEN